MSLGWDTLGNSNVNLGTEAEEERLQISVLSTSSLPREQSQPASHLLSSKTKVSLPHPPALFLEAQLTLNECPETQVAFHIFNKYLGGHLYLTLAEAHFRISCKQPLPKKKV